MAIRIRKWVTFREEILFDGERELERPLRRVAVAVVCTNPYAGRWSDDLAELIDFGEYLGDELTRRCQEALERAGRGLRQGRDRRRARRARARRRRPAPEVRCPDARSGRRGVDPARPSRSAARWAPRSTSRSTTSRRCSSARISTPSTISVPDAPGRRRAAARAGRDQRGPAARAHRRARGSRCGRRGRPPLRRRSCAR